MPKIPEAIEIAQVAYETYASHQDWKNYAGNPIPAWYDVRKDIQQAWRMAAQAVLESAGLLRVTPQDFRS